MPHPDSTTDRGRQGEQVAVDHLRAQGYRIIERNYRARGGEIDIIAEEAGHLCFVEVRSRADAERGDPLETVDPRKQLRVIRAARQYINAHGTGGRLARFDVVGIVYKPSRTITLVRDAFDTT